MTRPARIPVRELRNHVSEVLRRVESGETLEITVNNRPVALLVPTRDRPRTASTRHLLGSIRRADAGLRDDLAMELTQTTDDLSDQWPQ
ncbi:MAG TPA: type II toxin-antitoxin system prevent-host-death family antitoxin [Jiangellaceae bacterium]|jgi:prevent-host-death family protein